MSIIERLQKYMVHRNLNANKITVDAGLSVGLIGRAIKNDSGLNSETIEKILVTYTDLNPEWFVSGNGEMIRSNNQTINSNGSTNSVNSNVNGTIGGNLNISHSEFSGMIDLQKGYQAHQEQLADRLKTSQDQVTDCMRQITLLIELLKR